VTGVFARGAKWLARLGTFAEGLSAGALMAMVALAVVDVTLRKTMGHGVYGAVELIELLMIVGIYGAVPSTSQRNAHIQLELIDEHVPGWYRPWRERGGDLVSAIALAGGAWIALGRATHAARAAETTTLLQIGLGPFHAVAAALLVVGAAVHLRMAVRGESREFDAS
jgi:TRAP-type transport system small permease protein